MSYTENLEKTLLKVIGDLAPFLDSLVLVGGWVPFLYRNYLWKEEIEKPVYTTDIDFGFLASKEKVPAKTVYEQLSYLQYKEKHIAMDKLFPVVPVVSVSGKEQPIPVEFLTDEQIPQIKTDKFFGYQLKINRLEHFEMLLQDPISIDIPITKTKTRLRVPSPERFVVHKIVTHSLRQNFVKKQKDAYYAYYVLRFHPEPETLLKNIRELKLGEKAKIVKQSLKDSFDLPTAPGILHVEKEMGLQGIDANLRQDIFERFSELRRIFS